MMERSAPKAPVLLLVEDDYDWFFIFRGEFQKLAPHWIVLYVRDGMEAMKELAKMTAPQALVTDLMMPGMGGLELIEWIKNQPEYRHTPVFVISNNPLQRQRCCKLGVSSYWNKPRSLEGLQGAIRDILKFCEEAHRDSADLMKGSSV